MQDAHLIEVLVVVLTAVLVLSLLARWLRVAAPLVLLVGGVPLVVQGLTLPAVLRFARLPEDTGVASEEQLARRTATEAGLAALADTAARLRVSPAVVDRVREDYREHLALLHDGHDHEGDAEHTDRDRLDQLDYQRLRAALLTEKRRAVLGLRDAGTIDDIVLRRVQTTIDTEELRLTAAAEPD